ncbi:MAG: protoporphyrinogen oxidase [Ignavibacteria bacterium]|nr:protoporphyrinogen oxidase [Ignavibacteria bacterium]
MSKKIVVLGAGISGLSTAFWLYKEGYDVVVLEKNKEVGGAMESVMINDFLFDRGPNSGLETTPVISKLVKETGLSKEMMYANQEGNKRYILRDNQLHALPMNPLSFIKTKLFSGKAKMRLMLEPFIGRSKEGYYQSISQFVRRRLGQEFLDYAINPFVAGVYAGDPDKLSVYSAFPKLYELEEKYGGLIIGTIRSIKERKGRAEVSKNHAKMFSFRNGMQSLPKTIAAKLSDRVILLADVETVEKSGEGYKVTYNNAGEKREITADYVLSTVPAYVASNIFRNLDTKLSEHLDSIEYPPVMVLYLAYPKDKIKQPLDGFGFLIPKKEKKSFLGAIWSSVIFDNRTSGDNATFTLFIGGARSPEIFSLDKEIIIKKVLNEFHEIMGINSEPIMKSYRYWSKAIPQYNIGYIEHERYCDLFEINNPGIFISGNYRGGISVGDCLKNSDLVFQKINKHNNQ